MQINDFLNLLEPKRKKQDSQGSWICRCPAHDDKTESLHVKMGQNKRGQDIILVKCFAGCDRLDIVRALGLQQKDLTCKPNDDRPPFDGGTIRRAVPTYEKRKNRAHMPPTEKPSNQKEGEKIDHGPKSLEQTYKYTDEKGVLLYEACRYRYADGTKTFRQRRPDPEHAGQWKWDMQGTRLVLYRLPEVRKAIEEEREIWLAEGEKDADSLHKIGLCGTSAPMGAGKWNKGNYAESLRGATCYILPDNDEPGKQHAADIIKSLCGVAASARILDLRRIWPEIPAKNDVSDLIEHLGAEEAKKALISLSNDKSIQYSDLEGLYSKVPGYGISGGRICQFTENGARPLCDFIALPVSILTLDDGQAIYKQMLIRGWTESGKELSPALVPLNAFSGMSWVTEKWDVAANISPGNMIKDKLRYVIAEVGAEVIERRTEYMHTGWRKISGEWVYLHGGGAIGARHVRTALEGSLTQYILDGGAATPKDGFFESRSLMNVMSERLAVPLLCCVYLAPLRHFLNQAGIPPSFALFLVGKSGSRKTTAAALALSHFGNFTNRTMPASFHDTPNSVRRKAFMLKDAPIVVDDYHPTQSIQERRKMESMAQELARAFGDISDRSRMNADRTLQTAQRPRCLAMMTGEDLPQIGESGVARFFVTRVTEDDVPISDALSMVQSSESIRKLQASMIGYIEYLRAQADELPVKLKEEWLKLRSEARRRLPKESFARSMEAIAHLMLGWEIMLMYGYTLGAISREELGTEVERAWRELIKSATRQSQDAQEETPVNAFINCVREMLGSKHAYVKKIGQEAGKDQGVGYAMIGYMDDDWYMLLPDMCYKEVNEVYMRQGSQFPLSKKGLLRALKEAGITDANEGEVTRVKWIQRSCLRVICIRKDKIDGGDPPAKQQGFLDVTNNDQDNPFEKA